MTLDRVARTIGRVQVAAGLLLGASVAVVPSVSAQGGGAQQQTGSGVRKPTAYENMQMFSQVLNQIRVNHPDSLETYDLFLAAVAGLVQAADPHSYVIPAIRLDANKEAALRAGRLVPVPVEFAYIDGAPVVVGVAPGTAARLLDILPGDELTHADGRPVVAESPMELLVALAGPRNAAIPLTFMRRRADGSRAVLVREVKRERAEGESAVPTVFMLDAVTGYARITSFMSDRVADDLHGALQSLERQGMSRLVLDLRDNGGGSVDEAASVAGEFLPKGTVVYTATGRKADMIDTGRVKRSFWKSERRYPIVVLVNEGTASASELVAGALQDHDRALIVGRTSFGKALMMRGFPMTDGSVIVLVVGHIQTPCGRVVQRQYRGVARRAYFRDAGEVRDTIGRPSCRTTGGRTVYGGGGIVPDVLLGARPDVPLWVARLMEDALPLKWVGGYLERNAAALTTPDRFAAETLPAAALADFRRFAEAQSAIIPAGDAAEEVLRTLLMRTIAGAKWGDRGVYRVMARSDAEIAAAIAAFDRAASLTGN
ncbi:MAG: hypothetical protein H0X64_07905 [Gemmatimonadaceae bacterium]|nr:hypothetical protein [Gemmatimonadaceae bacterium]